MPSRFASSVDMGHASMGHVSRRGFARRACCCCLLLLLLVIAAAAGGAAVARGYTHALQSTRERIASQRQRCLKRERTKKSGLRPSRENEKLGQSKASGKFSANRKQLSNLISTIFGSTIICFPNMTNLAISSQICLGSVISRR